MGAGDSASNRDLQQAVKKVKFRLDLFLPAQRLPAQIPGTA